MKDYPMEYFQGTKCDGSGKDRPCGRLSTAIAERVDAKGKPGKRLELCELCFGHLLFSREDGDTTQYRFAFRHHSQDLLAYFKK